eukprot:scaffold212598_cov22-Tisochrysis_lutea.AAC.3
MHTVNVLTVLVVTKNLCPCCPCAYSQPTCCQCGSHAGTGLPFHVCETSAGKAWAIATMCLARWETLLEICIRAVRWWALACQRSFTDG